MAQPPLHPNLESNVHGAQVQNRGTKQREHQPGCEPGVWDSLWQQELLLVPEHPVPAAGWDTRLQGSLPSSRDPSHPAPHPTVPNFMVPRSGIATATPHLGGPERCRAQTPADAREAGAVQAWLLPALPWQQLLWACFLLFLTVPDASVSKQWHLHTDWEPLPRSHRAPAPGRAREGWEWPGRRRAPGRDGGEMKGSRLRRKLEQQA